MKDKLFAVGLNELLGFVRLSHSASPDHTGLILSSTTPDAAWRFESHEQQLAIYP
jgi:hypothetical protein